METLVVGKIIYHEQFGLGVITKLEGEESANQVIYIDFSGTEKKLLSRFAKFKKPTQEQLENFKTQEATAPVFYEEGASQEALKHDEINKLEKSLGQKLPEHYKNYLQNFPTKLASFKREYSPANEIITERHFRNTLESIIKLNQYFEAFELDSLIAIGDDGTGSCFAIKADGNDQRVFFINHEGYLDKQLNRYSEAFSGEF